MSVNRDPRLRGDDNTVQGDNSAKFPYGFRMSPAEEIKEKALRLLALRAHSTGELSQKLLRKFPQERTEIESILAEFVEFKILDDLNFAKEYVHYRQSFSPRGKFALKMELQKKDIAPEIIAEVLGDLESDNELAQAQELAEKKLRTFSESLTKAKQKEKLFRFLVSRGFSQEIIWKVCAEILK